MLARFWHDEYGSIRTSRVGGAWGLVPEVDRTRPVDAVRFVLGLAVAHDLVVAPLVVAAAACRVALGGPSEAG